MPQQVIASASRCPPQAFARGLVIAIASRWCSRVAIAARGAPATCGSLGVPVPRVRRCVGGDRHDV